MGVSLGTADRESLPVGFAAGITNFSAIGFSAGESAAGVTVLAVDNGREGAGGLGKIGRSGFARGEAVFFAVPGLDPLPEGEGIKLPSPRPAPGRGRRTSSNDRAHRR